MTKRITSLLTFLLIINSCSAQLVLPFLTKENKYRFVDGSRKFVSDKVYDWVADHLKANFWAAKRSQQLFLIDSTGNEIFINATAVTQLYKAGDFTLAILGKDNKYGLLELQSKAAIPIQYDEILPGQAAKFFIVKQNQGWGVINLQNKVVVPLNKKSLLFINDTLVVANAPASPQLINLSAGQQYGLSVAGETAIKSFSRSDNYFMYQAGSKIFVRPLAQISDTTKVYEFDKFIVWIDSLAFAVQGGGAYLVDRFCQPKYKLPYTPDYSTFRSDSMLLFKNGQTTHVLSSKGDLDSMCVEMSDLSVYKGGVINRKDSLQNRFCFFNHKLRPVPFEGETYFQNFSIKQRQKEISIINNAGRELHKIGGVEYIMAIDDHFALIQPEASKTRKLYAGNVNKWMDAPKGWLLSHRINGKTLLIVTNEKERVVYDSTCKELARFDDVYNFYFFKSLLVVSDHKNNLRLINITTWVPLPTIFKESSSVFTGNIPYAVIFDTHKYFVTEEGIILKE